MTRRPLIFGEVLFDEFPDGTAVLGGAPFNVAWHLQGFGLQPRFISAVGDDALGEKVLQAMRQWGMDTTAVQILPQHPTGRVQVKLDHGQPDFTILDQQAYDHIAIDPQILQAAADSALLYHGSLATRHPPSRTSLQTYVRELQLPVFIDINLRAPWWQPALLPALVSGCRWLKLNDHELAGWFGDEAPPAASWQDLGRRLFEDYALQLLIVTHGEKGASLLHASGDLSVAPPATDTLIDTVGAGDAFSAVTLVGLMADWPLPVILARATQFAARICGQRGATAADPALYQGVLRSW